AFESALEVFPIGRSEISYDILDWNRPELWRSSYLGLNPNGTCFAQDAFAGQFVLCDKVYIFEPETGNLSIFASTLEEWAKRILDDYDFLTGYSIAREWQMSNGPIPFRNRLIPKNPFVLGGSYRSENLEAMDAAKSLR